MYPLASSALTKLVRGGEELCVFPQIVREFWNVATRPVERNGLGLPVTHVESEVHRTEAAFTLLEDGLAVYREWLRLASQHRVLGVQVHDCYLAASVRVREIERLLTFNPSDFARYGITAVDPVSI